MAAMRGLADLLYPELCVGCSRPARGGLCAGCLSSIPLLSGTGCRFCGRPSAVESPSCRDCRGQQLSFDSARQAAAFDQVIRSAIHQLKYSGRTSLVRPLSCLVVNLAQAGSATPQFITWVPASADRLRKTGTDHARALARLVADQLGVACGPTLARVRSTPAQMSLKPDDRRRNLQGAFVALDEAAQPGIVLVDDVFTTGSTASEASRALKDGGSPTVDVLCVARSYETL